MDELPFVSVISTASAQNYCSSCFKRPQQERKLQRCSQCKFLHFCNKECQRNAWTEHKMECKDLERLSPRIPPELPRILARIIRKTPSSFTESNHGRSFQDLMSHKEDVMSDSSRVDHFASICFVLKEFLGEVNLPSIAELSQMFGKVLINAFSILNSDLNPIGTGIYLCLSGLDHSCDPNAVVVFDGQKALLRPLKPDTDLNDNSTVRLSYIELLAPTAERRRQLKEQYYFLCDCANCLDKERDCEMRSFACEDSTCPGMVFWENFDEDELVCGRCNLPFRKSTEAQRIFQESQWQLEKIESLQKKSSDHVEILRLCEEILEKQDGILHGKNVYRVRALEKAMDCGIELELWDKAIQYGRPLIQPYNHFYKSSHPNLILHLTKLGKVFLHLEKFSEASELLSQASRFSEVSYGSAHPFLEEVNRLLWNAREEQKIRQDREQLIFLIE